MNEYGSLNSRHEHADEIIVSDLLQEGSVRQRGIRLTKLQKVGSTLVMIYVLSRDDGDK
jgi:hypothetical protein